MAAQYSLLVNEVVGNEGAIGPALRLVYESENVVPTLFQESLQTYTKRMDAEIERMCSKSYQGFLESIEELLELKDHAAQLKETVSEVQEEIKRSGKPLVDAAVAVSAARTIQLNCIKSISALMTCLPVLRLFVKANTQLANRRYYAALKTMTALQTEHIPPVAQYTFAKRILDKIPVMKGKIKDSAAKDMQDFLLYIRDKGLAIGEAAMNRTLRMMNVRAGGTTEEIDYTETTDLADFSPIYRCLHIYDVLGARAECEEYYKQERKKQGQLVLEPPASMASITAYKKYLYQVAGFFLVEDTVLNTTQNLLSRQWIDDLWEGALTDLSHVIKKQLDESLTAVMIGEIKQLMVLFNQTLQAYSFKVTSLFDLFVQVRDRYTSVLTADVSVEFAKILAHDDFAPLKVDTEEEFKDVVDKFSFDDRVLSEAPFPRVFPFSKAVVEIYTVISGFVENVMNFVNDLDLSSTEIDEMVRKATNNLLSKALSGILIQQLRSPTLSLSQLIQLSINTTHLEHSADILEQHISKITHSLEDDLHVTRLHGATAFKDVRSAAEQGIFSLLQHQMDMFFELAHYNWMADQPRGHCSEYIFDMLAYLTTTFATNTNMPEAVARAAYFSTCKYLNSRLLGIVTSDSIKRINFNGIKSFALDIVTCEQYAENCPIPSIAGDRELFEKIFASLSELVNLFLNWEWDVYLDANLRKEHYAHVPPVIALSWLEKFDDSKSKLYKKAVHKLSQSDAIKRLRVLIVSPNSNF